MADDEISVGPPRQPPGRFDVVVVQQTSARGLLELQGPAAAPAPASGFGPQKPGSA